MAVLRDTVRVGEGGDVIKFDSIFAYSKDLLADLRELKD